MDTRRSRASSELSFGADSRATPREAFFSCKPILKTLDFRDTPIGHVERNRLRNHENKSDIWMEAKQQAKRIRAIGLSQFDPFQKLQESLKNSISICHGVFRSPSPPRKIVVQLRPLPVVYNLKGEFSRGHTGYSSESAQKPPTIGQVQAIHSQSSCSATNSVYDETVRKIDTIPVSHRSKPVSDSSQCPRSRIHQSSGAFKATDGLSVRQRTIPTKLYSEKPSDSALGHAHKRQSFHPATMTKDLALRYHHVPEKIPTRSSVWDITAPHTIERSSENSNCFNSHGAGEHIKGTSRTAVDHPNHIVTKQKGTSLAMIRQRAFTEAPSMDSSSSDDSPTMTKPCRESITDADQHHNTPSSRDEFFSFKGGSPDILDSQSGRLF